MKIAPRFSYQTRFSVAALFVATVSLIAGSAAAVTVILPFS